MTKKAFITVVSILVVCMLSLVAAIGWQMWRVQKLSGELSLLNEKNNNLSDRHLRLNAALEELDRQQRERIRQQQEQVAALKQIQADANSRQIQILELHNEATNQAWAATELPADIIRLHRHPILTGSAHYREFMQHTGAVPIARQQSEIRW